jgi:chromosomal replication initiation ATPase DnaA
MPRQIAMYLCKSLHACLAARDRAELRRQASLDVIHSIRKVEELRKKTAISTA